MQHQLLRVNSAAAVVMLTLTNAVNSTVPGSADGYLSTPLESEQSDCAACGLRLINCLAGGGAIIVCGVDFLDCWDDCMGDREPPMTPTPEPPRPPEPPRWWLPFRPPPMY